MYLKTHVSEDRQSPPKTSNQSHSRRKGLVNHVPGLKRKGCPSTLTRAKRRRFRCKQPIWKKTTCRYPSSSGICTPYHSQAGPQGPPQRSDTIPVQSFKSPREVCGWNSCCTAQGKPVVAPPAEHAAHRPKSKHGEESINRTQLTGFELIRVAARANASGPQDMRQPGGPGRACSGHAELPFSETRAYINAQLRLPNWDLLPTRREMRGCCPWPWQCTSRLHRSRD